MQVRFLPHFAKKKLKLRISKKSVKYRLNGLIRVLTNEKIIAIKRVIKNEKSNVSPTDYSCR